MPIPYRKVYGMRARESTETTLVGTATISPDHRIGRVEQEITVEAHTIKMQQVGDGRRTGVIKEESRSATDDRAPLLRGCESVAETPFACSRESRLPSRQRTRRLSQVLESETGRSDPLSHAEGFARLPQEGPPLHRQRPRRSHPALKPRSGRVLCAPALMISASGSSSKSSIVFIGFLGKTARLRERLECNTAGNTPLH